MRAAADGDVTHVEHVVPDTPNGPSPLLGLCGVVRLEPTQSATLPTGGVWVVRHADLACGVHRPKVSN